MAFNIRQIFRALADARVDYVVVGGFAVIMHGHLRATRDLDLVIGLAPDNCARALVALEGIGLRPRLPVRLSDFADPDIRRDWIDNRHMRVFQLWDPVNPVRSVDVFVREPFAIGMMLSEATMKDYDGVRIPVASIRHLIAMKRAAGRRNDLDDIEALREIARETGQPTE
jgi:hypothetical protein